MRRRDERCGWRREAVALARGQPAAPGFAAHLEDCPACAEAVTFAAEVLGRLERSLDDERPSPRLVERVLAGRAADAVEAGGRSRASSSLTRVLRLPPVLRAAAAVLVLAIGAVLWTAALDGRGDAFASPGTARPGSPSGALPDECAWLVAHQTDDGGWPQAAWRGPASHRLGAHALAMLALAAVDGRPDARAALSRAADWLVARQSDDGTLGVHGVDHALATLALVEAARVAGDTDHLRAARDALRHLGAVPTPGRSSPGRGAAVSAWTLLALERADSLGLPVADGAMQAARLALARVAGPAGVGDRRDRHAALGLAVAPGDADGPGTLFEASRAVLLAAGGP